MKRWILGLAIAAAMAAAVPAQAVTVDDIIGLTRADASDAIILAKIDSDGTVFHLTVDDILALKKAGVSDQVITYMINTGKGGTGDQAPAADEPAPAGEGQGAYDSGNGYRTDLDQGYRSDGGYGTGLDSQYRGSVSASFAYYYPQWPGYRYSYYYDPFYWPSWSYYWTYWQPYPYSYWYYDPWYRCNSFVWWYSNPDWYWDRYGHRHHDYANRVERGRHVGNRGYAAPSRPPRGERSKAGVGFRGDRRTLRTPSPGVNRPAPGKREVRPSQPPVRSERPRVQDRRRASRPSPSQGTVRPSRPAPPQPTVRPAPRSSSRPQPPPRPRRDETRKRENR